MIKILYFRKYYYKIYFLVILLSAYILANFKIVQNSRSRENIKLQKNL